MSDDELTPEFRAHLDAIRRAAIGALYSAEFVSQWPCLSNFATWRDRLNDLQRVIAQGYPPPFVERKPRTTRSRSKAKRGRGR